MSQGQENVVLIGKKPVVNYMLALIEVFNSSPSAEVKVKARGKAICKAVDVISAVKARYFANLYVKSFSADYEEVDTDKGKVRLPAVEITVALAPQGPQPSPQPAGQTS
ncbi:RNA-binding protein [Acidilobus sp.]|jgi:DNA-binding protein|uniref:RNA-binding protein n=1 Tax=Acidilobus sp. TaxID=1872109 RepID=UPI003D088813